jgi:hypothetical protein
MGARGAGALAGGSSFLGLNSNYVGIAMTIRYLGVAVRPVPGLEAPSRGDFVSGLLCVAPALLAPGLKTAGHRCSN